VDSKKGALELCTKADTQMWLQRSQPLGHGEGLDSRSQRPPLLTLSSEPQYNPDMTVYLIPYRWKHHSRGWLPGSGIPIPCLKNN
jgi:hypothetical protein